MATTQTTAKKDDVFLTFFVFIFMFSIVGAYGYVSVQQANKQLAEQPRYAVESVEFIPASDSNDRNVINDTTPTIRVVTAEGDFLLRQYEMDYRNAEDDTGFVIMQHTGEQTYWNNGDGTFIPTAPYTLYITPENENDIRSGYKERFGQELTIINNRKKE